MRKSVYLLAVLFAIATACSKEVAETPYYGEDVNPNAPVFKAGIETKATLNVVNSTTAKVNWANGDGLTIWNGTQTAAYSTTDSGSSATFTTGDEFSAAANYVAIYPADGSAVFSAGSVTTTLPAAQTAVAGTFDPAASIAVATSTSTSLSFNNLVTYVQFTVPAGMDDLTSVSFKGNAGEKVAGAVTIDTDTPALTATGSVTATLSGTFTEGETYYLAVAPGNYSSGYTLEITRGSNVYKLKSTKAVTFVRSNSRNIGILWDGTVSMEGAASGAMTKVPNTNVNASLQESVYSYRGAVSGGTLKLKLGGVGAYVVQDITIPSDGEYHVMYNATTGKVRVYSQDVLIHFGQNAPVDGYTDMNGSTISFTLNQFTDALTSGKSLALNDYSGNASGITVTSNSTFEANNNTFTITDYKKVCNYYVDDDCYIARGWMLGIKVAGTPGGANAGPASITLSGLDAGSRYDIRVSGTRYNGSLNMRKTTYSLAGAVDLDPIVVDNGIKWDASNYTSYAATPFKDKVAIFNSVAPTMGGSVDLTMTSISTASANELALNFVYISKVVYSKN